MTNYIGNISTIVKLIGLTVAGWIISALASQGLNLNVDVSVLGEVIGAIIGLAIGYIDAKYPNSFKFLGNDKNFTVNPKETVLNDEYECDDDGC